MTHPDFDPSWLLRLADDSKHLFKEAVSVLVDANREEAAEFERERIIKLLEKYGVFGVDPVTRLMLDEVALIARINSELGVCSCDPCNDRECDCYGKRCEACVGKDN
jgi:hypothetical protein